MQINYSLSTILSEYKKNKHIIDTKLVGKSIENYQDTQILGLDVGIFSIIMVISIALAVWSIIITYKRWNSLEQWAKILSVTGIILAFTPFGLYGPIITLLVVYLSTGR